MADPVPKANPSFNVCPKVGVETEVGTGIGIGGGTGVELCLATNVTGAIAFFVVVCRGIL
jgi:hypothetical protein